MAKLIEVQAAKDFANTFLNDIFFRMAVNRVLDAAPGFDLVYCKECKHYDPVGCADGFGWCDAWENGRCDNHYCNFGERKTE